MRSRWLLALTLLVAGTHAMAESLPPCPDRPNCVSSLAEDSDRRVQPLAYRGDGEQALARLAQILRSLPRTRVTARDNNRLQAETRSWLFGFVDRMDFLLDRDNGVIQLRSAAQSGYYDFGVNRRRTEEIRRRFEGYSE